MWDGGTEVAFVDYGMLGDGGDYESRCAYTQDIASVVTIAVFLPRMGAAEQLPLRSKPLAKSERSESCKERTQRIPRQSDKKQAIIRSFRLC